ncbi:hypothetical protein AAMO2058_000200500 [Amorphochlora amoebiformis]
MLAHLSLQPAPDAVKFQDELSQHNAIVNIGFAYNGQLHRSRMLPPKIHKYYDAFNFGEEKEFAQHPRCIDAREVVSVGDVVAVVVVSYKQHQLKLARAPEGNKKAPKQKLRSRTLSTTTTCQNSTSTTPASSRASSPSRATSIKPLRRWDRNVTRKLVNELEPLADEKHEIPAGVKSDFADSKQGSYRKLAKVCQKPSAKIVEVHELRSKESRVVTGTVVSVKKFGAFVDIGATKDGLIPARQLRTWYKRHHRDEITSGDVRFMPLFLIVSPGDKVSVVIDTVDCLRERLTLELHKKIEPIKPMATVMQVPKDNDFPSLC